MRPAACGFPGGVRRSKAGNSVAGPNSCCKLLQRLHSHHQHRKAPILISALEACMLHDRNVTAKEDAFRATKPASVRWRWWRIASTSGLRSVQGGDECN